MKHLLLILLCSLSLITLADPRVRTFVSNRQTAYKGRVVMKETLTLSVYPDSLVILNQAKNWRGVAYMTRNHVKVGNSVITYVDSPGDTVSLFIPQ